MPALQEQVKKYGEGYKKIIPAVFEKQSGQRGSSSYIE